MKARDYTKIPGYERMTGPQARYNYLHDLLEEYQGATPEGINRMEGCPRAKRVGGCNACPFSALLGGSTAVCCAWRAEAQPDRAIEILEELTEKNRKQEPLENARLWHDRISSIAGHYGVENQVSVAQEELAELIQALSKLRRWGFDDAEALRKVSEEMADVTIMLGQMEVLLGNSEAVWDWMNEKLERQMTRMKEEAPQRQEVENAWKNTRKA